MGYTFYLCFALGETFSYCSYSTEGHWRNPLYIWQLSWGISSGWYFNHATLFTFDLFLVLWFKSHLTQRLVLDAIFLGQFSLYVCLFLSCSYCISWLLLPYYMISTTMTLRIKNLLNFLSNLLRLPYCLFLFPLCIFLKCSHDSNRFCNVCQVI